MSSNRELYDELLVAVMQIVVQRALIGGMPQEEVGHMLMDAHGKVLSTLPELLPDDPRK